jgi:hypothetical protein
LVKREGFMPENAEGVGLHAVGDTALIATERGWLIAVVLEVGKEGEWIVVEDWEGIRYRVHKLEGEVIVTLAS